MHILCTICSDLVNQAENIHVIKCGHIFHHHCLTQWIERSKSCPQCRHRVTKKGMFRLFPTISDEAPGDDAATLQSRLDDFRLQLRQREELINCYKDILKQIKEIKRLMEENEGLKKNLQTLNGALCESESKKNESRDQLHAAKQQIAVEKNNVADLQTKLVQLEDRLVNAERKYKALKAKRKASSLDQSSDQSPKQPRLSDSFDLNTAIIYDSTSSLNWMVTLTHRGRRLSLSQPQTKQSSVVSASEH